MQISRDILVMNLSISVGVVRYITTVLSSTGGTFLLSTMVSDVCNGLYIVYR